MTTEPAPQPTTRERILDAAMDLFAEHGFRGTSIAEIERRVGLAAGTGSLYHHFSSKEALLREAVELEVTRGRTGLEEARARLPRTEDPDEWHARLYEQLLVDIRSFDRLFRLMLNEGERVAEIREAIWAALQQPTEDAIGNEPAMHAVVGAALGGYHLFSMMQGRPYNGVSQEEFIGTLVALTRQPSGREARSATR
ncbi:MAG: TetR/AcrR family transcriptional regulator [Acidimicrobiia bacterium]